MQEDLKQATTELHNQLYAFVVDDSGRIEQCQMPAAARASLGYTEDTIQGVTLAALFADDQGTLANPDARRQRFLHGGQCLCTTKGPAPKRYIYLEFQRDKVMGQCQHVIIAIDCGPTSASAVSTTQQEATLHPTNHLALLGKMSVGLVHDLNNMLCIITGTTEIARLDAIPGTGQNARLGDVLIACQRAADLCRLVMNFAKGRVEKRAPVDIARIINDNLPLLRAAAPSNITLIEAIQQDTPRILAAPAEITQLIMNLALNAVAAIAGNPGSITITVKGMHGTATASNTQNPGSWALLQVQDTGCGMDSETQQRIFETYFSTNSAQGGMGIGLATVRRILGELGGSVSVASVPGVGSTFSVLLPAHAEGITATPPQNRRSREHILYIDDESVVVHLHQRALLAAGYQVTAMVCPLEAEKTLRENPGAFDIVITDACMPGMDGFELTRRIKAKQPWLPVVMLTGSTEAAAEGAKGVAGLDACLSKPLRVRELDKTLQELLARKLVETSAAQDPCDGRKAI